MFPFTSVELGYLEILAKSLIISSRQNHFTQENLLINAPVRAIAILMSTNSAFTGSHNVNPFSYQHFDLRKIRSLRCRQPNLDFDFADSCHLHVTIMKAMNFQDKIPHFQMVFPKPLCTSL